MVKPTIHKGQIFSTNYGNCRVVKYIDAHTILIEFENTHYRKWVYASALRKGEVKDTSLPTIFGKGYCGDKYSWTKNNKIYLLWHSMLERVYANQKHKNKTYKTRSVCSRWHSLTNFGDDIQKMKNWNREGFQLDKDLRILGNKRYGKSTCSFVPQEINAQFTGSYTVKSNFLPGVCRWKKGYMAQLYKGNKNNLYGPYKTEWKAHVRYCREKSKHVRNLAIKYKQDLHPDVFDTLMSMTPRKVHEFTKGLKYDYY